MVNSKGTASRENKAILNKGPKEPVLARNTVSPPARMLFWEMNDRQTYIRVIELLNELDVNSVRCLILSQIATEIRYLVKDDYDDAEDRTEALDFLKAIEWMLWRSSHDQEWIPTRAEHVGTGEEN